MVSASRVFRPTINVRDGETQVLIEQTIAVAPERLAERVGHVRREELERVDDVLRLALELDRAEQTAAELARPQRTRWGTSSSFHARTCA